MLKPRLLRHFILLSSFTLVASTKTTIAATAVGTQAHSHMRSLLAENPRTHRFEERFPDATFAEIESMVEKLVPSLRSRTPYDLEKVVDDLFTELHVKSVKTKFFASKQYRMWAGRVLVDNEYRAGTDEALYNGLKKHFSESEVATFILDGLASLKTSATARAYYKIQIEDWVAHKDARGVFHALKLDSGKGSVFKNPLLETYVAFARQLPHDDVLDEQPIYDEVFWMLKQNFGVGRVAEMLGAPNVDLREGSVGGRVMNALFRDVDLPNGSLDYVKEVFRKYAVVDSPAISIWLSYAKWSLAKPDYEVLVRDLVENLWNQRGGKDKVFATVIAAAQKDEITRDLATNALARLCGEWKKEGKTTSDVLSILELKPADMKAEDIVESPLLETWFAFESQSHADDADLLAALQSELTEEQLASMLVIKTSDPDMSARLGNVRETLFAKWQARALDEDGAFKRLQLDKAGDKLFAHPALNVWFLYVYARYSPDPGALIVQVVKNNYRDSQALSDMVIQELKRDEDSSAKSIAILLKKDGLDYS